MKVPTKLMPLTEPERLYLREMRRLEIDLGEFNHRKLQELFGWKSVQASFDKMKSLIRKGYVDHHGERLAFVACPTLTKKGVDAVKLQRRSRITKRAA